MAILADSSTVVRKLNCINSSAVLCDDGVVVKAKTSTVIITSLSLLISYPTLPQLFDKIFLTASWNEEAKTASPQFTCTLTPSLLSTTKSIRKNSRKHN